jgi:probable phosphoglycerate mutase
VPTTLFLIRHGETELNAQRVVQPPDADLSARGREQARRLAERLRGSGIALVLSSDLVRAAATAREIAGATGAPLVLEPLLQERNFGAVRGTPYAELGFDLFARDYEPPGGESWAVFEARVDRAFARVEELAAGRGGVAVVTHGLVCRALAARHLVHPVPPDPEALRRWGNTSLTVAEGPAPWRVRLLNCTAHLGSAAADDPAA